jgi:hypothetical protein
LPKTSTPSSLASKGVKIAVKEAVMIVEAVEVVDVVGVVAAAAEEVGEAGEGVGGKGTRSEALRHSRMAMPNTLTWVLRCAFRKRFVTASSSLREQR